LKVARCRNIPDAYVEGGLGDGSMGLLTLQVIIVELVGLLEPVSTDVTSGISIVGLVQTKKKSSWELGLYSL
jgi:hypothetical protein